MSSDHTFVCYIGHSRSIWTWVACTPADEHRRVGKIVGRCIPIGPIFRSKYHSMPTGKQDADLVPTAGSYPCAEDYGRVIPLRGRLREGDTLRNVLKRVAPHRIMVREGSTPSCAVTKGYDPDGSISPMYGGGQTPFARTCVGVSTLRKVD